MEVSHLHLIKGVGMMITNVVVLNQETMMARTLADQMTAGSTTGTITTVPGLLGLSTTKTLITITRSVTTTIIITVTITTRKAITTIIIGKAVEATGVDGVPKIDDLPLEGP